MMNPNPTTLAIAKNFSDLIANEGRKNYQQRESKNLIVKED